MSLSKHEGSAVQNFFPSLRPHGNSARHRFVLDAGQHAATTMTGRIVFDIEALIGLGGLLAVALAWDTLKGLFNVRSRDRRAQT